MANKQAEKKVKSEVKGKNKTLSTYQRERKQYLSTPESRKRRDRKNVAEGKGGPSNVTKVPGENMRGKPQNLTRRRRAA